MKKEIILEGDSPEEVENQPKVQKLLIEYEDGKIRYLEGEDAQKHLEQIDDALGFMQVTRSYLLPEDFLESPWKEITPEEAAKLFQK